MKVAIVFIRLDLELAGKWRAQRARAARALGPHTSAEGIQHFLILCCLVPGRGGAGRAAALSHQRGAFGCLYETHKERAVAPRGATPARRGTETERRKEEGRGGAAGGDALARAVECKGETGRVAGGAGRGANISIFM